jgi:hypothetical protein
VVFDRSRAADYVGGVASLQSPPMLLLPLLVDGGAAQVTQSGTAWRDAWGRWQGNVTPIDYVLPGGTAADNLWLSAAQVRRTDPAGWRSIITRFDTVDVLVAEARLTRTYPGGPIRALFIARHGAAGTELGRLALKVGSEAGLARLLDEGVKGIDALYAQALRDGRLRADPDLAVDVGAIYAADVLIGTVLVPGAQAPKLVSREMVRAMKQGAVIVDVCIDQGGCCETSRPTTHAQPTYVDEGVLHYCVTNMPGAVPRTSTFALNNATLPFALALADKGWREAMRADPHLRAGLNVHAGKITCAPVALALGLELTAPEIVIQH